jgi:transposase
MTTTTAQTTESTAADATLYLAFELGSTKWVLAFTTSPGQRPRLRVIPAGDLATLVREIALAQDKFKLSRTSRIRSCYEAGRDGFWLHRWLLAQGITNVVVDSSSIEVNRRARRAKTDRLDAGKLVQLLMRAAQGEPQVWSEVRVPTLAAEAARQLTRELATVREDRTRIRNRIFGLLATQGIRDKLTGDFAARVATLQTGDGQPVPLLFRQRLEREWAQLQTVEARRAALRAARTHRLADGQDRVSTVARDLCRLRGIAEASAALYSAELFGTRTFQNGRQLGALTGLVPVPYRSDQRVQDQGISKAGRGELRRVSIQVAWCWLRWQPGSALAKWFHDRFGTAGGRSRRVGIVAVARKLVIALWRFVAHGVVPEGAELKPAA